MIGVVIVSHSARLAEGVVELAEQVAQGKVRLAAAGGTADGGIGTDAFRVQEAIEAVDGEGGVLVLMDLGSAVLSAETALEFLDEARRARVRLCSGPLVEGAVAAVSVASAGGNLEEAAAEAEHALEAKSGGASVMEDVAEERRVTLRNRLGLHARPGARLIRLVRRFDALVTLENVTAHRGPVEAGSLNGILGLRGRQGDELLIRTHGSQAHAVLEELVRFVESGCGDVDAAHAIGASPGIAVGPLVRWRPVVTKATVQRAEEPEVEWRRLETALDAARVETRKLYESTGAHEAGIFDAQLLLLEDALLIAEARRLVFEERRNAASAWQGAASGFSEAADMSDVTGRVLEKITGASEMTFPIERPSIVAARDLMPSQLEKLVEKLDASMVLGLCLETGGASGHTAILARARGIPTVVGLGDALAGVAEGTVVAIDGAKGEFRAAPNDEEVRQFEVRRREWLAERQRAMVGRKAPATTRDGRRITLLANLNREAQVTEAVDCGAEGVGVLRTEFLFLDRTAAPSEEEQFTCYRNIAEALGDRVLVIRTLDIGGDKSAPYVEIGAEANPFLGWRGLRVSLGRRDLFETQLRAIVRAARGRRVEVLLPMVSTLEELREAKRVIREMDADIPVGAMIEVPAAAVMAERLAREVSRLSIGTNDLVQYVMAADRTNARVAAMADPFQPAVLRLIRDVVRAGREAGIRVDVCGEMAADPQAAPLLVGLGVDELSMSPPMIPEVKQAIGRWTLAEAEELARRALEAETVSGAASVRLGS